MLNSRISTIYRIFLAVSLAVALGALPASAESPEPKPRVALFSFRGEESSPAIAAACVAASRTLAMTIGQLPGYELLDQGKPLSSEGSDELRLWAARNECDYILFGSISSGDDGSYSCELSLFDRLKGGITISRNADDLGALDLFEAADELVASVLGEMTGRHIGFCRLEFRTDGENADYEVFLDGSSLGVGIEGLGAVLAGPHSIRVVQKRILGELTLYQDRVVIPEGAVLECSFSIPAITDAERATLEGIESSIRARWGKAGEAEAVEASVEEYQSLLAKATHSSAFDEYRLRALQVSGEWSLLRNRLDIEERALSPSSSLFDPTMVVFLAASSYPDPGAIRQHASENARLLAVLLEISAGERLCAGDAPAALSRLESILDFSRCLPADYRSAYAFAAASLAQLIQAKGEALSPEDCSPVFAQSMRSAIEFRALDPSSALARLDLGPRSFGKTLPTPSPPQALSPPPTQPENHERMPRPTGSLVRFLPYRGQESLVELEIAAGTDTKELQLMGDELSCSVPAGEYNARFRFIGDEAFAGSLSFIADGSSDLELSLPRVEWSDGHALRSLQARRADLVRKPAAHRNTGALKATGWTSLVLGTASLGAAIAVQSLGSSAYETYLAASDASVASEARARSENYSRMLTAFGISGAAALVALPIFLAPASATAKLQRQIASLDRQIEALSGKKGGE